jgi:hypothetical protein
MYRGNIWMILILAASVMAGCGKEGNPEYAMGEQGSLRSRTDTARNRLWVLGLDDVRVYDVTSKRLIRRVVLPGWSVARFVCAPDMVLDGSGSAIVSSNVQARLWRVDAATFEVKEQEIRLQGREQWDTGFGALAFAADGSLLGLTAAGGTLWRISVAGGSARPVGPDARLLNVCEFTTQLLKDLERSLQP